MLASPAQANALVQAPVLEKPVLSQSVPSNMSRGLVGGALLLFAVPFRVEQHLSFERLEISPMLDDFSSPSVHRT